MEMKWAVKFPHLLLMCLGIFVVIPSHVAAEIRSADDITAEIRSADDITAENYPVKDHLDRLMERCSIGNTKACDEIDEIMEKHRAALDRYSARVDAFEAEVPSLNVEHNNKPDIRKAYPIILKHYMSSDAVEPIHRRKGVKPDLVNICSKHLHDLYFIHGKEIPTLESGKPDWGTIYLVTIEHYFRFCSVQFQ